MENILAFLLVFNILLSPACGNASGIGFGTMVKDAYCAYIESTYNKSVELSDYEQFKKVIYSKKFGDIAVTNADTLEVTASESKYALGNFKTYSFDNYCTVTIPKSHLGENGNATKRNKTFTYKSTNNTINIKAETGIEAESIEKYVMQCNNIDESNNKLTKSSETFGSNTYHVMIVADEVAADGAVTKIYYTSLSNKTDVLMLVIKANVDMLKNEELNTVSEYILKSISINCSNTEEKFGDSEVTNESNSFDSGIIEVDGIKCTIPFELSDWLDENFVLSDNNRFDTLVVNGVRNSTITTPSGNNIKITQRNTDNIKKALYASDVYGITINSKSFSDTPNVIINGEWKFGDSLDAIKEKYGTPNFINNENKSITYISTEKNYSLVLFYDDNYRLTKVSMVQHVSNNSK